MEGDSLCLSNIHSMMNRQRTNPSQEKASRPGPHGEGPALKSRYLYVIKDEHNTLIKGELNATSLREAIRLLEKRAFTIISIEKVVRKIPLTLKNWNLDNVFFFFRRLLVMHRSGVHIKKAFDILNKQSEDPITREIFHTIEKALEEGKTFAQALGMYPEIFSKFHRAIIRASEEGGFLDNGIEYLTDVMEREIDLKKKISAALTYPVMIFFIGLIGSLAVCYWIFPYIQILVNDMGVKLPLYSQMMINVGDALRRYYILFPLVLIAVFVVKRFFVFIENTLHGKIWWERLLLSLPFIKDLKIKASLTHALIVLASLTNSGVTLLQALELSAETSDSFFIGGAFHELGESIKLGETLNESMARFPDIFPRILVAMVKVGEESGELAEVLLKTAELYEIELTSTMESFTKLIEPLAISALGLIVGFILLSFFIPIYSSLSRL
ncbi:MAG: type II secretion system F family protein [Candidatus Eremiobacteraeota bacterium]|nr:type II secretion system F family protein [Candidatus Eremiobacteraeota bacterium]